MDGTEEPWKDEVREKLVEVFAGNAEDLCRVLLFLDEEDKAYKDNVDRPYAPQWKSLKATLNTDDAFREFAKRLANETRKAVKDQKYRNLMNMVYEAMMPHCDDTFAIEEHQKLDIQLFNLDATFACLARACKNVPAQLRVSVMKSIEFMASSSAMTAVDDVISVVNTGGGTVAMVGLASVHLIYSAYVNIKRWWKGDISGKRCVKNVLDSMFTVGTGVVGGCAGVAFGTAVAGPIGTVVGGIVGGWLSAVGMASLFDWLTQKLFGLPKEEALENAYRHLGVEVTASNAKVNTAFRKLCLKHHPDKGGSQDDFHFLQCNMTIIKQARGDF